MCLSLLRYHSLILLLIKLFLKDLNPIVEDVFYLVYDPLPFVHSIFSLLPLILSVCQDSSLFDLLCHFHEMLLHFLVLILSESVALDLLSQYLIKHLLFLEIDYFVISSDPPLDL